MSRGRPITFSPICFSHIAPATRRKRNPKDTSPAPATCHPPIPRRHRRLNCDDFEPGENRFAGRARRSPARQGGKATPAAETLDNLSVTIQDGLEIGDLADSLAALPGLSDDDFLPTIDAEAVSALKFSDCLPRAMATRMLEIRSSDLPAIRAVLAEPMRRVASTQEL